MTETPGTPPDRLALTGKDNYGKPRQNFADALAAADEEKYLKLAELYIWLSAYAANNRRSDYHWKHEAVREEADRRGKPKLYTRAFQRAF